MKTYWEAADELQKKAESFVVVTVVGSRGSAPQDAGAKALVTKAGLYWGTVGGGKVEARAIVHSQNILCKEDSQENVQLITWNLQRDIGMSCGGEITYLFEVHRQVSWPIVIFGAGHVSQALIRVLVNMNCQITCVDSRPEWLERLPESYKIQKIHAPDPSCVVAQMNEKNYFVIMTQGHAMDLPILKQLYTLFPKAPYIGNIGSRVKGMKLRKELKEFGVSENTLKNFNCPIGLEFGSNHPYEIAISVSAQLLQVRDQQLSSMKENDSKRAESSSGERLAESKNTATL